MSTHVTMELVDGHPVACKRPTSASGEARIRAEADRLAGLEHPGVVRLLDLRNEAVGPVLVTEYVGARTLETIGIVSPERAAALAADLAATVADLHAAGTVHGAVRPEHVLVAGDRTVLCSPVSDTDDVSPADDVAGIGLTLRGLLDPDLEEEPIPDRRPWRRVAWRGYRQRALLNLADQATADEPGRRPGARALAESLAVLAGSAPAAATVETSSPPTPTVIGALIDRFALVLRPPRRLHADQDRAAGRRRAGRRPRNRPVQPLTAPRTRRRPLVLLAGVGVGMLAVGLGAATARPAPTSPEPAAPIGTESPGPSNCRRPDGGTLLDLDGDGCAERVTVGAARIVVDGRGYRVGAPGNDLAIGDWDCDGRATVVLLQRGRGRIWHFPRWDPTAPVTAEPVAAVPGGSTLRPERQDGCDRLLVERRDTSTTLVDVG